MTKKITSVEPIEDDLAYEVSLRPKVMDEFIGQKRIKENLKIFIEAAKKRKEALDHVLISGPPGLGKTTLAHIIANEMGVPIRVTSGPTIERAGDLAALLTNLSNHQVLFIDEIHRLSNIIEEILYPAMEDYRLDIIIGQGPSARSIKLELPKFTLVGATTRTGLLTSPLRGRFGIVHRIDFYAPEELKAICLRSAKIMGVEIDDKGATEVSHRSRGTPRVANRLLRRIRDYAEVKAEGKITLKVALSALSMLEVDKLGFDEIDRKILLTIIEKFNGGPVGLNTLSAAIGEEKDAIEDVHEPFLLQCGFIDRTPRGRKATQLAYKHFGLHKVNGSHEQEKLW